MCHLQKQGDLECIPYTINWENLRGVVDNMFDCNMQLSDFKIQSRNYNVGWLGFMAYQPW